MSAIGNHTIKRKLIVINMITTCCALLLSSAALITYDFISYRAKMVRDLNSHAGIIASNSTAAISFSNGEDATQILASLKEIPFVDAAATYQRAGASLATYALPGSTKDYPIPTTAPAPGYRFTTEHLELSRSVILDGKVIGTVWVREDLTPLFRGLIRDVAVGLLALFGASFTALVVIGRLQRRITSPIEHLSQVARAISLERDYSARAQRTTDDELGELVDCFNEMLCQIQSRDADLDHARQASDAANHAKSDFLANMSHEIRTPMTAILGYADMLMTPGQSGSDRLDCVHTIRREGEHLLTVLNDILDLSKIEAGKMQVERIACRPTQVVNEVISLMRVRAIEKNLRLIVTYAGPVPESVLTDPTRLRQILINLMGNAIKFTHTGSVQVVVSLDHLAPDVDAKLRVEVIDSGIGMDTAQISELFQPFVQADASTTRRFGGTGLGLVICRRLAQMLGGDIYVQSRTGCGSRFTVTIGTGDLRDVQMRLESQEGVDELPHAAKNAAKEKAPVPQIHARVLLAEDGVHNQRVIAFYLQQAGVEVTIADNGRVACEKAMDGLRTGKPFDLVLMDMQMPELDGYGATAALRSKGYDRPIIALTAHAMSQDREKCLKAGCTDYLSKPVDRDLLIEAVTRHLGQPSVTALVKPVAVPSFGPLESLRSTELNNDAITQFLPEYVADLPATVGRLALLLDQQNLDDLTSLLHQIKGTGGLYGFMPITEAAERIEKRARAAKEVQSVAEEVRSLIRLIRRVEGYEASKETAGSITVA